MRCAGAHTASAQESICIGLNYREHAAESKKAVAAVPTVFSKFSTAVIGPGEAIVLPGNSAKPDYEAELAVVIGQGGRHIPEDRWREHVFGYTMLNDVSARDFQMATSQWIMGKTFDTFAPLGPAIVTADEIADPQNLAISLVLSGEVMQNSNTREMIFPVPRLIAFLSSVFTLEPGDVIATGTPAGRGFRAPAAALVEARRRGDGARGRPRGTDQPGGRGSLTGRTAPPLLLLGLAGGLRPDALDGHADQFHRVDGLVAAARRARRSSRPRRARPPPFRRSCNCRSTPASGSAVMKNWQPPESGPPLLAMASLPGRSNRNPGRNSSRMVTPQLCVEVPSALPDWIILPGSTR